MDLKGFFIALLTRFPKCRYQTLGRHAAPRFRCQTSWRGSRYGLSRALARPRGHHPYGAPYGFEMYYLNVMASPLRKWRFVPAPEVEWIMERDA